MLEIVLSSATFLIVDGLLFDVGAEAGFVWGVVDVTAALDLLAVDWGVVFSLPIWLAESLAASLVAELTFSVIGCGVFLAFSCFFIL